MTPVTDWRPPATGDTRVGASSQRASGYFRVLAIDFDGTLAEGRAPRRATTEALARARTAGLQVVLVTGRILHELRATWPTVATSVDCIVAENGAVLASGRSYRLLGDPVDHRLDAALAAVGVPFRRGDSLLAASVTDEASVLEQVRSLQLDCQTVANRTELMVVPAGVSKGSGLHRALGHLGLSFHNTVAVGDAENDLALLDHCELAVAVGNAVEPLKARADVVLDEPDGEGVVRFLDDTLLSGGAVPHSRRWQLELGTTGTGVPVRVPASRVNVLLVGGTGAGKSYLAGLLAEQLVDRDYSILVVDPEGDHVGLGNLSGALVVGGSADLPAVDDVLRLLHHRYASVIVDLSGLGREASAAYQRELFTRVEAHRHRTGLPHWVFVDEADRLVGRGAPFLSGLEPAYKGYCLATWRPEALAAETLAAVDVVVASDSLADQDASANLAAAIADRPRAEVADLLADLEHEQAVLARRSGVPRLCAVTVARRRTPHLRHIHKYEHQPLDAHHCFHFRRNVEEATGRVAANLLELETELTRCERRVLCHHCPRHDFSRWVADVFHDPVLSRRLARAESAVRGTRCGPTVEEVRLELLAAIAERLVC